MKYNFDEIIDRVHSQGSYSTKWSSSPYMAGMFKSDTVPEDRLCFFVADMDFKCAPEIIEATKRVAEHGIFGYSTAPKEYFDAVIRWMKERYSIDVTEEQIHCAQGAHHAVVEAVERLTKPGDGVIVPLPTYYYRGDINGVGRYYVGCQMKNDNGYYTFDWDAFEAACKEPQNTMVILMQPHNPTGRVWTEDEIRRIADICRKNNVIMLCDDVHIDFKRHGKDIIPFMNVVGPEGIVMITGLGKTFNLAGLSLTNVIIKDEALMKKMGRGNTMLSPFSIAACIAAYNECGDWVDQLNAYLDENIDYVVERVNKEIPGAKVHAPEGSYILWIDFTNCGYTAEELDARIGGKAHIGLSDGAGMEPPKGTIFRRFCVTSPKSVVIEAVNRLVECMK